MLRQRVTPCAQQVHFFHLFLVTRLQRLHSNEDNDLSNGFKAQYKCAVCPCDYNDLNACRYGLSFGYYPQILTSTKCFA